MAELIFLILLISALFWFFDLKIQKYILAIMFWFGSIIFIGYLLGIVKIGCRKITSQQDKDIKNDSRTIYTYLT